MSFSEGFQVVLKNNTSRTSYKSVQGSSFHFSPTDISLDDDRFHGSDAPRFTEWWYFDAVFDNGYSVQMSVRVLSIIKNRVVRISQKLDVYKNGVFVQHNEKIRVVKEGELHKKHPCINIDGTTIIKGEIDKKGVWRYTLLFPFKNASADLVFKGCATGWKGINPGGDGWGVIFPRAIVRGILKIRNEKMTVNGIGYHDHNWDVRAGVTKKYLGWFWGRIHFPHFTATWATIFTKEYQGLPILLINKHSQGYENMLPKDIVCTFSKIQKNHRHDIPTHFEITAKTQHIHLDVSMDAAHIHHVKKMMKMHYWRYHNHCQGSLIIHGKKEEISSMQIAEFLKF